MIREKLISLKEKITNNPSFTVKEQLGYAGGVFGNEMGQDSVNTFSDKFFRDFMGIENRLMTIMGNIFTVTGLAVAPIAGNVVDTPVRQGKRTPTKTVLLLSPIPFAVASMLLFVVPFSNAFYNFLWTLVIKLIYNTADAFYDTSLTAMSLRMTTNAKDRKNFFTLATLAQALGSMLPGWLIPLVVGSAKTPSGKQAGYFFVALAFCVLGLAAMFAPYFTLNEKLRVEKRPDKVKINWDRNTIATVLHSRSFVTVQIGNFFEQIRQLSYKLLPYIYEDCFGDYKMKAIIDAVSGTLSYAGLASVPFLNSRFSARTIMSGSYAFTGVFYSLMALFGIKYKKDRIRRFRYLIGLLIGISGMPNNAIIATKKVLIGDATDYMEWYSTKEFGTPIRSEGLISTTQSILGTAYNFIRTNFYNVSFEKIRYSEGASKAGLEQSDGTLRGLYLMFTLCGVFGNLLAAATYLFDNFTGKRKEAIMAELLAFRARREELREEIGASETG